MSRNEEWLDLLVSLTRLTQEGKLKWVACNPPDALTAGTDDIIDTMYITEIKGRKLGVFEKRYEAYSNGLDKLYWTKELVIAFLHPDDSIALKLPPIGHRATQDLLDAIQYQHVRVDDFLKELLIDANPGYTSGAVRASNVVGQHSALDFQIMVSNKELEAFDLANGPTYTLTVLLEKGSRYHDAVGEKYQQLEIRGQNLTIRKIDKIGNNKLKILVDINSLGAF